jgi:hypothetical protein
MKVKFNLMLLFLFVCVCLMIQPFSLFAQLIEPSRTLKGQQKPMGRLSVHSEPPKLNVLLDGTNIGNTPVISKEVTPGAHVLRVKDIEKEIIILPGKFLRMSFYKDALIEIPEKKAEVPAQPKSVEKTTSQEKETDDLYRSKEPYHPFYWPLNPSGPIK